MFNNIVFIHLKNSETQQFDKFRKDGHRTKPKIRLMKSWKAWIWDPDLSEHMKWIEKIETKKP